MVDQPYHGPRIPIKADLLELLACVVCKGPLTLSPGGDSLTCSPCSLTYPVSRDGIPDMRLPVDRED